MLITIDIRHCLKILLIIALVSHCYLGVAFAEDEDFAIDVLLQPPKVDSELTANEDLHEKKAGYLLRSPQLIPDMVDGIPHEHVKRTRRKRPKRRCQPGEFYHTRGRKCVPERCPDGTGRININNGDCVEGVRDGRLLGRFIGQGGSFWQRKQKVIYQKLPPRFGPGMGISGRFV